MARVLRFLSLGHKEKMLILQTIFWLVYFRLGLWMMPTPWCKKWICSDGEPPLPTTGQDNSAAKDIIRAVRECSRYVPRASCLTQALAAKTLLDRHGFQSVLKIGAARNDGKFEAHAWIEIDGRIVLGKQPFHSRYAVFEATRSVLV